MTRAVGSPAAWTGSLLFVLVALVLAGCSTPQERAARQETRYTEAKALFDDTTRLFHLPSAQAGDSEKTKLLAQAAGGYEQLLRRYADQPVWCAQALRSLGNVRAEQGRLDAAVKLYTRVAAKYPAQDWEILQAWKTAADLLWDAGRPAEAKAFYRDIVKRYSADETPVAKLIVRASRARLD